MKQADEQNWTIKLDPEQEKQLIEGFLSRSKAAELDMVHALRPLVRREIYFDFPSLWPQVADLEQSALVKLFELRADPKARKTIEPPLPRLAKYLVDAPARVLMRALKRQSSQVKLRTSDWVADANQEAGVQLHELRDLAATLPRGKATTLLAHAAYVRGEGPPLHEALGIDERAARMRLVRAQEALWARVAADDAESDD